MSGPFRSAEGAQWRLTIRPDSEDTWISWYGDTAIECLLQALEAYKRAPGFVAKGTLDALDTGGSVSAD